MGALSQYLEREGIATTHISLVREHTEAIRPPRALWVPFMLGRPFGAPGAAELQRKVLLEALRLLEAEHGPLLEDFAEQAPALRQLDEPVALACPVSFGRRVDDADPAAAVHAEIAQLRQWHDIALRRSGSRAASLSGMDADDLGRLVASASGLTDAQSLKRACDDLKAFYIAAAGAQPGNPDAAALERWFWHETAAGKLFLNLRQVCLGSSDPGLRMLGAKLLVPRTVAAL